MKGMIYAVYTKRDWDTKLCFEIAFETRKEARQYAVEMRKRGIKAAVGSYCKRIDY